MGKKETFEEFVSWDITQCSPFKSQPMLRRNMPPSSSGSSSACHLKMEVTLLTTTAVRISNPTKKNLFELRLSQRWL
jgi:hypothetical protein